MNITIIGTGYVGLVTGACLADLGNQVFCLDVDEQKIALLNSGGIPIYEPGLKEVIERNVKSNRLTFSNDVAASVQHSRVQIIAVGTPPDENGSADLKYVLSAANEIGRYMTDNKIIVNKSTVPVGTADKVSAVINSELDKRFNAKAKSGRPINSYPSFTVVSNPEFLKEGASLEDFTRPDRIILGVADDVKGKEALDTLCKLYAPFNRNHERTLVMDVKSAEFTKYAANAMLATRISFMNELANLAEVVGADIELVRQGIGSDPRIGYSFLYAGAGYGGSCFPKDIQALIHTGREHKLKLRMLEAVEAVNHDQKQILVRKIFARFGSNLHGKKFAIWGLAFKPNTDDMREAPSRIVISALLQAGARIFAHDPVAQKEALRVLALDLIHSPALLDNLQFMENSIEAVQNADALIIVTEWKAYRSPAWSELSDAMKSKVIFDGRNLYKPIDIITKGFEYHGVGRGNT